MTTRIQQTFSGAIIALVLFTPFFFACGGTSTGTGAEIEKVDAAIVVEDASSRVDVPDAAPDAPLEASAPPCGPGIKIDSVSPQSVVASKGALFATITGCGFTPVRDVTIDGVSTKFVAQDNRKIIFEILPLDRQYMPPKRLQLDVIVVPGEFVSSFIDYVP